MWSRPGLKGFWADLLWFSHFQPINLLLDPDDVWFRWSGNVKGKWSTLKPLKCLTDWCSFSIRDQTTRGSSSGALLSVCEVKLHIKLWGVCRHGVGVDELLLDMIPSLKALAAGPQPDRNLFSAARLTHKPEFSFDFCSVPRVTFRN